LQRNKTSLHIVTSVGYSIEYYDARNNKYQVRRSFGFLVANVCNHGKHYEKLCIYIYVSL